MFLPWQVLPALQPVQQEKESVADTAGAAGVCCRDIHVIYDGVALFDGLSLDFQPGRCTCLLGPSGCGKSTLLRIISGTREIDFSGSILFTGEEDTTTQIAWMSQKDLLLPWMSVLDNITLGAKLRGERDAGIVDRARDLLARAGLAECATLYPAALSGGMRQRAALLRTLMEDRPVLLMDEPFSALDALTRLKLQDLSARLTKGKTVILVTHDPLEALRLGDRIVVLGKSPAQVVADIEPGGEIPRKSDDPALVREYPLLLKILLSEDGA